MWKKRDWNPSSKMLLPMALSRPRQHGKVSWIFEGAFKFFPPNHTFRIRFPILFERFMSSIKKYVHSITILIFTTHLHFTASSELCLKSQKLVYLYSLLYRMGIKVLPFVVVSAKFEINRCIVI